MQAILNLVLSSFAFLLSAAALLFNVVYNRKERKRNIRQTLTSTLNEVAKINVEISKLEKEEEAFDPNKINERRNFDFQRNTLCLEADFLIHEKPELLTAIDCSLMAFTYGELHDFEKAEHYWKESIYRTETPEMKLIHMRDYGFFLYQQNRIEQGRVQFHEAFKIQQDDTDDGISILIDTHLLQASSEYFFNYEREFEQHINVAGELCDRIKNKSKKEEMKAKIEKSRNISEDKKEKKKESVLK